MKRFALAVAGLVWLAGCETTSTNLGDVFKVPQFGSADPQPDADRPKEADKAEPAATGTIGPPTPADPTPAARALLGADPYDDLSLAKNFFRQGDFGLAERYFRRAAEAGPRDAEAWLGLAASYDRLKRFDLADRAYEQVLRITGPTAAVLNNLGYSYMLRGDYGRAREKLLEAQAKDPDNAFVRTNLDLLGESQRTRKAIR